MLRNRCEDDRGLRGRLTEEEGVLARPDGPSRCTLPITALRVMPPSSMAIRLAESPSAHSFFRSSTRSSVHIWPLHQQSIVEGRVARPNRPSFRPKASRAAGRHALLDGTSGDGPPHEMSYLRACKVQYGGTRAQESTKCRGRARPRFPQ